MELDPWQEEVMKTPGNLCLRSGRQVGKSTVIALKAALFALDNPDKLVMIISKTERQAGLLFGKILNNLNNINRKQILKGKDRPTKHKISLKNKSVIHSLPAGDTGFGLMGFTIDLLIADEAAFIQEEVWNSIIPALAITRGNIWLLSTPFLKKGYYYSCFQNKNFTQFHTSSEDCPRKDIEFLEQQRKTLTKAQYAQMYLGLFVDDLMRFFSDDLIKKICILERKTDIRRPRDYYLGVDIARMGKDESTFETLDGTNKKTITQIDNIMTRKTKLTETEDKIIELDTYYSYKRKGIGIDDAGLGAGVHDTLLRNNRLKNKIVGLSNARKSIDVDDRQKKLLKEDMYNELLRLMERGEIQLLNDDELKLSLSSIQFDEETQKIFGTYSHIAEGLIRATWCIKNKSLNIMAFC